VNPVKQTILLLLIAAAACLLVLPFASLSGFASAQTSSYTIDRVDHQVQVMYSGHVLVIDTIHVSGTISYGFMIGLPYQYSADVLKAFAYDDTHLYSVNLGVQLSNRSGLYGAEVVFNGNSPNVFSIAFVLSNSLLSEGDGGNFTLNYPAYPSLTQTVGVCNVTVTFPSIPSTISISKDDGSVNFANYLRTNLPAYTYSIGDAKVRLPTGTVEVSTISNLNREINIDASGAVTATETFKLESNSTSPLGAYVLSLPSQATNIAVRDPFGAALPTSQTTGSDLMPVNVTFSAFVNQGQSTSLTVQYNLPGAVLEGSNYVLSDFQLFPRYQYLVADAVMTFNPPEGSTIVAPQASALESSSTLTRQTYQDTLTVTRNSISYADYLAPQQNSIELSYSYNPVWSSFRITFYASLVGAVVCAGAVVFQRHRTKESYQTKARKLSSHTLWAAPDQRLSAETIKTGQPVSPEVIKDFVDTYKTKQQLTAELNALDVGGQKGKISRRQYKAQKQALETRIEGLNRSIERTKAVFRGSSGTLPDLVKQLDLAEEDLATSEAEIKKLEERHSKGELAKETYKLSITDYQKMRSKAESAINGILQRLREKIR
jgi:hypothetical protein